MSTANFVTSARVRARGNHGDLHHSRAAGVGLGDCHDPVTARVDAMPRARAAPGVSPVSAQCLARLISTDSQTRTPWRSLAGSRLARAPAGPRLVAMTLAGLPVEVATAAVQAAPVRQDLTGATPGARQALCGRCDGQAKGEGGKLEHAGILRTHARNRDGIRPGRGAVRGMAGRWLSLWRMDRAAIGGRSRTGIMRSRPSDGARWSLGHPGGGYRGGQPTGKRWASSAARGYKRGYRATRESGGSSIHAGYSRSFVRFHTDHR